MRGGEPGENESGRTDSMAAVRLLRLVGRLCSERWSSWSDMTLQSSLAAPATEPLEDRVLGRSGGVFGED